MQDSGNRDMSFFGGGGGGITFKVVEYVGDGSVDKVIDLPFTPKVVYVMQKLHGSVNAEQWYGDSDVGFSTWTSGAGFRVVGKVAHPEFFPFVSNGFNIGKAHNWNGIANAPALNLMLIAIG